jgi:hypothetical protein
VEGRGHGGLKSGGTWTRWPHPWTPRQGEAELLRDEHEAELARTEGEVRRFPAPPPPPSRTNWTRLVPPSRTNRTNWTRLVPPSRTNRTRLVPLIRRLPLPPVSSLPRLASQRNGTP